MVPQEALRRQHDQRLAPPAQHLPAETWKYWAGVDGATTCRLSRAARLRNRSSRALECSGPDAFQAVRQEQHQPAQSPPAVGGAGDELVDDHLAGVGKVAELGLPGNQAFGLVETVAVLESEHARFAEGAVDDLDGRLIVREMRQGTDTRFPSTTSCKDGVPLAERAPLRILSAKAGRGCPSTASVARASASAADQSSGSLSLRPSPDAASMPRLSLRCR